MPKEKKDEEQPVSENLPSFVEGKKAGLSDEEAVGYPIGSPEEETKKK